jgi:hypothetical protein
MLLGVPGVVVGSVLLAHLLYSKSSTTASRSMLSRVLLACAAAAVFFNTAGRTNTLYVWRWTLPEEFQANELWHEEPARARDIALLRERVPPHSSMYVLPQRHNSIYFFLESHTASPTGYTFVETDWEQFPWDRCEYFVLLTHGLIEDDYDFTSADRIAEIRQTLVEKGFRQNSDLNLSTMQLYSH